MKELIPIIIPAYKPDERLLELLDEMNKADLSPVIVVNDGSGEGYDNIFLQAENIISVNDGVLLEHDENKGKGRALKTAFEYVLEHLPEAAGVVTADSDGQHTVDCIGRVANELQNYRNGLILGVRSFAGDDIPWKSRFGNNLTEKVFKYATGVHVSDTQTGLRGIPREFLADLIGMKGERYEFETRMLMEAAGRYPIREVPIKTVYDSKDDHTTSFNPVLDSIRIYRVLGRRFLGFAFSSMSSSIIDLSVFALICRLFRNGNTDLYIAGATFTARIISAVYNYLINYKLVFKSREKIGVSGVKYVILAMAQLALSALLVTAGVKTIRILPEVVIKMVVDTVLFFISYYIQQNYVFRGKRK